MRPPGHVISRTSSALKTNFASCSFIFFMGLHIKMMSYTLSTMPVIVLDTNVFVSALRSEGGASREVLRCILLCRYMPLFGNALWLEYEGLLNRPIWADLNTPQDPRAGLNP